MEKIKGDIANNNPRPQNLPSLAIENVKTSNNILERLCRVECSINGGEIPEYPKLNDPECMYDILEHQHLVNVRIIEVLEKIEEAIV